MQHTITPYAIRCFNRRYTNPNDEFRLHDGNSNKNYAPIDDISGIDLFDLLEHFILEKNQSNTIINNQQVMYSFDTDCLLIDKNKRIISGYMKKGQWGNPALIQDIHGEIPDYNMSDKQAPMMKFYFCFYLPRTQSEGICLFHSIGTIGIKTTFEHEFRVVFQKHLPNLVLQFNPLQFTEIYREWENAVATKLHVTKFKSIDKDKADTINAAVKPSEQELIIKIQKPFRNKLIDFFRSGTDENSMVEILEKDGSQIKGEFELDGKKRKLRLGKRRSAKCDILIESSDVSQEQGILNHEELVKFCDKVSNEISKRIHKHE